MDKDEKNFKILEMAENIRRFEIELFWKRSLFFWGFTSVIASAYGYAHFHPSSTEFQLSISCIGLVCSIIWTLVNRSSKYWQKQWEEKAKRDSLAAIHKDLYKEIDLDKGNFPWWDAHFSVSKLATAFSDFTVLIWAILILGTTSIRCFFHNQCVIFIVTIMCVWYLFNLCKPSNSSIKN